MNVTAWWLSYKTQLHCKFKSIFLISKTLWTISKLKLLFYKFSSATKPKGTSNSNNNRRKLFWPRKRTKCFNSLVLKATVVNLFVFCSKKLIMMVDRVFVTRWEHHNDEWFRILSRCAHRRENVKHFISPSVHTLTMFSLFLFVHPFCSI